VREQIAAAEERSSAASQLEPESRLEFRQVETLEVELGYGLIELADEDAGGDLLERISRIKRQCALEMGLIVHSIRIRDNLQLKTNEYIIKIKGIAVAGGEVMPRHLLAMNPAGEEIDLKGIPAVEPAFGLPALWIEERDRDEAELKGCTVVDAATVLVTHLGEIIKTHSHELIGRQEVKQMIDALREDYSAVIEELVPNLMSLGEIQKVLQNLLRENVPIKDLVSILETLADYAGSTKNLEMLTEYVRFSLSRTIVQPYLNEKNTLQVITIHPSLEKHIADNIQVSFQGSFPAIEPSINTKILEEIHGLLENLSMAQIKPVILVSPKIRAPFKRMIEMAFPQLAVLSLNEVPNSVEIEAVGMVNLHDN
jgi:flagellar biosynthesis protein FlhA